MTDRTHKPITTLLSEASGGFHTLIKKAQELAMLNELIQNFLPALLKRHVSVANFRQGNLILFVESAAWATRLRYQIPTLLQSLRTDGKLYQLCTIDYRIKPRADHTTPPRPRPTLSATAKELISDAATHIKNKRLKHSMRRLAET